MSNLKSELEKGCGEKDGFKRKCGNVFESWKDGNTNTIIQEIRYYCPSCIGKQQLLSKIVEMIKENPVEVYCEDKNDGIIVKQAIEIFRKSILQSLVGSEDGK